MWIPLLIVIAAIAIWIISVYNGLISARNQTQAAWSDIDVQLKRRYDLIPNLVETVKGYASHEAKTLEAVIQARNMAMKAESIKDHAQAENVLTGTLKSLFALSENYPNLRASENFSQLQDELSDTEDKIQAARRFYNGNVRDFNTKLQVFPNNIIANMFAFKAQDFFELDDQAEKQNVKVSFK